MWFLPLSNSCTYLKFFIWWKVSLRRFLWLDDFEFFLLCQEMNFNKMALTVQFLWIPKVLQNLFSFFVEKITESFFKYYLLLQIIELEIFSTIPLPRPHLPWWMMPNYENKSWKKNGNHPNVNNLSPPYWNWTKYCIK